MWAIALDSFLLGAKYRRNFRLAHVIVCFLHNWLLSAAWATFQGKFKFCIVIDILYGVCLPWWLINQYCLLGVAIHLTAHNFLSTVPSVFNVWCRLTLDAFFIDGSRTSALELQNSDCLSFVMASSLLNVDDEIWVISHFRGFYSNIYIVADIPIVGSLYFVYFAISSLLIHIDGWICVGQCRTCCHCFI